MSNYIDFQRERDFGGVINATSDFVKGIYKPLSRFLFTYTAPLVLIISIVQALWQNDFIDIGLATTTTRTSINFLERIFTLKFMVGSGIQSISFLILMASVYAYVVQYVEKKGENIEMEEAWERAKPMFLPYLGTLFIVGLILFLSSIALLIPAIYLGVVFSLVFIVQMAENNGFSFAASRCFQLIKGNWWQTFGIILVMYITVALMSAIFVVPAQIYKVFVGFSSLGGGYSAHSLVFIILDTLAQFLSSMLSVISMIALAIQYYNLVEQKESPSLLQRINLIAADSDSISFLSETPDNQEDNTYKYQPHYSPETKTEDDNPPSVASPNSEEVKKEDIKKNIDDDLPKFMGF